MYTWIGYALAWLVAALAFGGATFLFTGNENWGWGVGLFIVGSGAFASILISYLDAGTKEAKSVYDEVMGNGS